MAKFALKKALQNILLSFISIVITLILVEVALRIMKDDKYYVWSPYMKEDFLPSPAILPGIYNKSRFETNSEGIRADEFSENHKYRILTVGGSTTECLYLDQDETWPYLLQQKLNERFGEDLFWVGNIGKSGLRTIHHVKQVEKLLEQYPQIDAVILLVGINDFQGCLIQENKFIPLPSESSLFRAFDILPDYDQRLLIFKRTEIWRMISKVKNFIFSKLLQLDSKGHNIKKWRKNRQAAKEIRNYLPDLSIALDDYALNINKIIDIANKKNTRVVFLTQPAMWKDSLSKEIQNLFWFGGVGSYQAEMGNDYYSVEVLQKGMNIYNEILMKVCKKRNIECLDLASVLPKDTTIFYDDCHFNENGARIVAEFITEGIANKIKIR
jgi:lysophospholipase L1-like esterase